MQAPLGFCERRAKRCVPLPCAANASRAIQPISAINFGAARTVKCKVKCMQRLGMQRLELGLQGDCAQRGERDTGRCAAALIALGDQREAKAAGSRGLDRTLECVLLDLLDP